jgi:hypothetical protein
LSTMCSVLLAYQTRLAELYTAASQFRASRSAALIAFLITIALCCVLSYFSLVKRKVRLPLVLVPLPISLYACKTYFNRRSLMLNRLRISFFYEKGCRRLQNTWAGSGETGIEFLPASHPYVNDLNVLGEGSLFELLCTCRTRVGQRALAHYLLGPISIHQSLRRQQAIQELKENTILREQIAVLGKFEFQQASWETITNWLQRPVTKVPRLARIISLLCSLSLFVLSLLAFDEAVRWNTVLPQIALLFTVNTAIGLYYRKSVSDSAPSIRSLSLELSTLRDGLQLMTRQNFESDLLRQLACDPCLHQPKKIRRLDRLVNAFVACDREWFYMTSRFLSLGTNLYFALESWRHRYAATLLQAASVWGEFEALVALANYAYEHPENAFPTFSDRKRFLDMKAVGHPLLPPETSVANDIRFDERSRFYVISGSNMAGKSTVLRTIGLNLVLAFAGAPVCARELTLSRLRVCASISIQDSLSDGVSKFLAEMERIKQAFDISEVDGVVLFLIDEILSGTNSTDRRTATELILREFIRRDAIGALSTHDLSLTELAAIPGLCGKNMHMQSKDAADPLQFDYLLKPGVATRTNALAIARLAGVPV